MTAFVVAPAKRAGFGESCVTPARERAFMVGALLFGFVVLVALLAPIIAPSTRTGSRSDSGFAPPPPSTGSEPTISDARCGAASCMVAGSVS